MEISFGSRQLARTCSSTSRMRQRWGPERAWKVQLRLDQIAAAASLEELMTLPQARCHQLHVNRDEQYSVDLDGPHRLILEVDDQPIPRRGDGGIDTGSVESVVILEIADTH